NVAITPPYGHNGYFANLRDMVSFHNSRDTGNWPAPEVSANLDDEVGNMGLSDQDIDDIVAFLGALTDEVGNQFGRNNANNGQARYGR
ncbi:MAG: hypothetical protein GXO58_01385, partial [Thermodesulfobacteria bacterium]|nr:hypothetical protein [Thermodesulfobacteriota bacterium]